MGLRIQLLLVSLTTLLLPWAGCHYVQEMEQALRENQSTALQQQAAILGQLVQTAELPWDLPEALFYTPRRYQPVQVDGYGDDWQSHVKETLSENPTQNPHKTKQQRVILQKALFQDRLYLFLQVKRSPIHYHNPGLPFTHSDHVRLTTHDGRMRRQWVLFTSGPGQLQAYQWLRQQKQLQPMQDMEAWWQETNDGFNVEISVSQQDLLPNLALELYQVEKEPIAQLVASTLNPEQARGEYWLRPLPALGQLLQQQRTEQRDAVLLNPQGWPLSPQKDWINQPPDIDPPTDPESLLNEGMSRFYRLLIDLLTPRGSQSPWPLQEEELSARQDRFDLAGLDLKSEQPNSQQAGWYQLRDQQRSALLVSQPLFSEGKLQGYLLLSQTGDALISLTNQALRRVTHLTLGVLALAILALVIFASSLSWRIRSLKHSAELAISCDGKINPFRPSTSNDEIGDLSRSYQSLLQRVQGYTEYLETLNGKLAHELRTPLAIVKSSLELARSQTENSEYLQRAEEGIERLRQILSAMSEASRVEQTIQHSEFKPFDLVPLLQGLTQAYADTYPDHRYAAVIEVDTAPLEGSPELMAQLLDKLVDNARSFAPQDTPITLGLQKIGNQLTLWVRNEGSSLPQGLQHQLFDSLVSQRDKQHQNGSPHLGLGLYIVRLIAEAHKGRVQARNLPQNNGVEFSVTLTARTSTT